MKIFPAIDLMGGQVVRLVHGDFNAKEVYSEAPSDVLDGFYSSGARNLHLVDLDGAREGRIVNYDVIKSLCDGRFFVEVGGGIRDEKRIEDYLSIGVNRVILGTVAVTDIAFCKAMIKKYGDAIAIGVDAKDGFVAINGWKTVTQTPAFHFCREYYEVGAKTVIFTDIATDGAMEGTNLSAYKTLSTLDGLQVVASGGICKMKEIRALKKIGVYGAILGKALYKGALKLNKIVEEAERE